MVLLLALGVGLCAASGVPVAARAAGEKPALEAAEAEVERLTEEAVDHGAHGEANANPLEFQTDLALWTGVVFLVLLAVLWKYAWGPMAEGLRRRETSVANDLAQAEEANRQARALLDQYEQKLLAAQDDVRAILERGRHDAEKAGQELIDKARAEAHIERQRALQEIDAATSAAIKQLAEQSAEMAVDLAGRIVGARLKAADHAGMIERAVTDFSARSPSDN